MNRVQLQPAYILHRRPHSNTSLWLDLFSIDYGRMNAIARGARAFRSHYRGKLELFSPLLVSWSGRHELKTLGAVELENIPIILSGDRLSCGFYLNELIIRLLHREEAHTNLFFSYQKALMALQNGEEIRIILRCFEKHLLKELGYGLPLQYEINSDQPLTEDNFYYFYPDRGFSKINNNIQQPEMIFSGRALLALHDEKNFDEAILTELKRLLRIALQNHLGYKPLNSRALLSKENLTDAEKNSFRCEH